MRNAFRTWSLFTLLFSSVGCNMDNNAANNNDRNGGQVLQENDRGNREGGNIRILNNGSNGDKPQKTGNKENMNDQGYHGHIDKRPGQGPKILGDEDGKGSIFNDKRYIHIQLLGINDLHGQLNVTRQVGGKPVGRVDYLAAYLRQRESQNKNTLLVQVGDMIGASPPISALLQDEPTIKFLNSLNFDIGTVGNHEFDKGVKELQRIIHGGTHEKTGDFEGSSFPWIVANVVNEKTGKTILPPYKVVKVNGMPIGFIGVVTTDTPNLVIPSNVQGLKFTDEAEAINKSVAELKNSGVRAIVVLAHNPGTSNVNGEQPTGEVVEIANSVDDEVDIIYGGHNHAHLNSVVDGKLLVQSYSYGTAFSDVDIAIDPKTKDIAAKKAEIVTVYQGGIDPDAKVTQMVEQFEDQVRPMVERVIGPAANNLTAQQNESGESALGNLIADAQRASMNTDFAFMNPGGIRADIDKGDVTWGELYTVQPFGNDLIKMNLTGKQIRQLLNQQWRTTGTNMLQISGLTYTWDDNQPIGQKVQNILLKDGTELDENKTYTVTGNNFIAGGGDGFTVFREGTNRETGAKDLDALVRFIENLSKPFSYEIEGRINKVRY
ncbi:bifunctional metallophosphatase/5'-nucleotidase [Bacillus songklensis]|uniref:Bifunctional metallophosphatase/5'-nucleotidase n=1 Tax=Bacillus songklensis TaxID=1069116 RepID=A0ABV8B6T6_9BACI